MDPSMRNQFVKMPTGLPWFALLLTLRAAAADKLESKPGVSLEPDTTLSATAAPTPEPTPEPAAPEEEQ